MGQGNPPRGAAGIRKSRGWLDALEVDPLELREKGIKGKKKLAEQLDAYHRLLRVAPVAETPQLLERIKQVAAVTHEDRYHDLAAVSDLWFKQDATSYLRVALLMDRMGLETKRYREEIKKIHPRLDAQSTAIGWTWIPSARTTRPICAMPWRC